MRQEYAVDRWYNYTAYDAFLDGDESKAGSYLVKTSLVRICPAFDDSGENLTIHEDVTYSSDAILDEANAKTIGKWGENVRPIADKATVRFEIAVQQSDPAP